MKLHNLLSLGLIGLAVLLSLQSVSAQTAVCGTALRTDGACGTTAPGGGCPVGQCCSRWGYCGSGTDYCNSLSQFSCVTASPVAPPAPAPAPAPVPAPAPPTACPLPRADFRCGFNSPALDNAPCALGQCCSEFGWCGANSSYCNANSVATCGSASGTSAPTTAPTPAPTAPTPAPTSATPAPTTATPAPTAATPAPTTATPAPTTATPAPTTATPAPTAASTTTAPTVPCPLPRSDFMCGFNSPAKDFAPCAFGQCCSEYGWCGSNSSYCNANSAPTCQGSSGTTPTPSPTTVPTGGFKYLVTESCGPKAIALTFDDGPNFATDDLIAALRQEGIPATVFINANNWNDLTDGFAGQKCERMREAAAAGIEIESHSYAHKDLSTLNDAQLVQDLTDLANWLRDVCKISTPIKYFRPPFGILSQRQAEVIYQNFGYVISMWNGLTGDTERVNPGLAYVTNRLDTTMPSPGTGAGALVLAHDASSVGLYADYIKHIKARYTEAGYRFVTMSECWETCNNFKSGISGKMCTGPAGPAFVSSISSWT